MVLTYVCTNKCYFQEHICEPGDRVILDEREGDAHPWFVRDPELAPLQADMQRATASPSSQTENVPNNNDSKAKAPVQKAGAKAPSNGGKAR